MAECPEVDPETGVQCMLTTTHTDHVGKVRWTVPENVDRERLQMIALYGVNPGFVAELTFDGLLVPPSSLVFVQGDEMRAVTGDRMPMTLDLQNFGPRW